ncbi:MAG: hypothetical protein WCA15_21615 [Candidatus Acidiferrales bacterium]
MSYTIDFVGVASAIFVSFAVALGLEWLSLVLMMRLMPAKPEPRTVRQRMAAAAAPQADESYERKAA